MTMSMLPMMADTSATRQPLHISPAALRLLKQLDRARTRKGTASVAGRAVQRRPQHWPGAAVGDGLVPRQHADAGRALHENVVVGQQRVVLGDPRLKVVEELLALADPALRQVVVDPADGDVTVGEP